jgi:hypothetical protein
MSRAESWEIRVAFPVRVSIDGPCIKLPDVRTSEERWIDTGSAAEVIGMITAFCTYVLRATGLAAIALAAGCGPSERNEGDTWSHAEMIGHLRAKGLRFKAKETHLGAFFGPAMELEFAGDNVYVQVRKTAQDAKDHASPKGEKAFAWGRFFFEGEPKRLAQIEQALP